MFTNCKDSNSKYSIIIGWSYSIENYAFKQPLYDFDMIKKENKPTFLVEMCQAKYGL